LCAQLNDRPLEILRKPFSQEALLRAVRSALTTSQKNQP